MEPFTETDIENKVRQAIQVLLEKDRLLLELNVNERSITHKLAEYLQVEFPGCHVDCEYNRDGHDTKELELEADKDR